MKSNIEGITEQSGIYAGKEGYDIQVKNNTRLKGAVIDSKAEKEKNRITTGTLTWENIENKAEYKTGGHGISYNGKIGRGDKNDPLDSQTNNRYGKDAITGQRNGMNKITPTIYGSKIPLNERGLLNTPIPSVKGKAGTTTRSAVAKETITITDKENQKQDIEKLNRNTENSLNKLKEIFDKTKVEERKRLLEELGIVGNQAIHEIASHNGWKDGSAEKIALHGMLGAITSAKSGGSALSGLIAGGANEYAIGYLEKSKGKDWINKHPDTVQNISAAFGGILSKMTGGSGHTGAYISQMGTKWNELDEEMEAREAVKEIIEKEVWNQIENSKESTAKEVMREAHYLVDKGIIDPTNMIGDYVSTQLSLGEGLKAGAVGCIVDKEGNVYATLAFAPGGTVGVPLVTGYGFLSDKSDGYINSISGLSGSFSAIGGFGGTVGVSGASIIGEINASGSVGVSLSFAYTWYVRNIYQ